MSTMPIEVKVIIDPKPAIDALASIAALTKLVAFVDGLTYSQLDRVPGLFDAAREARKELPKIND